MGLLDYLSEKLSDASESISDSVSDMFGNIVDNVKESVSDKIDDLVEDVKDSINDKISEVKNDLEEDIIDRIGDVSSNILSNKYSYKKIDNQIEDPSSTSLFESDKEFKDGLTLPFVTNPKVKKNNNNQGSKSRNKVKNEYEENLVHNSNKKNLLREPSVIKKLEAEINKLEKQEEKAISNIENNGANFLASISRTFINEEKYKRASDLSKKILGKTKEEKITEIRINFDIKKSNVIKKIVPGSNPKELWELLNFVHSMSLKQDIGKNTKLAFSSLLDELMVKGDIIFPNEKDFAQKYSVFKDHFKY